MPRKSPASPEAETRPPTPAELVRLQAMLRETLPGIAPELARFLAEEAGIRRARVDEIIWAQGEPVPLTLLIQGHGAFRRTTGEGQQITMGIAIPGEIFGITSVSGTISTVEMFAMSECLVAIWKGTDLRSLAASDPALALELLDRMALFLNILTAKVDGFLHQGARHRVVRILSRYRPLIFSDRPVLSRARLPGLVGTSREMTGRVLRELEREGTIARVGRNGLRLLDPDRLDATSDLPASRSMY
jgi:CRP-like cAMP-binding protein